MLYHIALGRRRILFTITLVLFPGASLPRCLVCAVGEKRKRGAPIACRQLIFVSRLGLLSFDESRISEAKLRAREGAYKKKKRNTSQTPRSRRATGSFSPPHPFPFHRHCPPPSPPHSSPSFRRQRFLYGKPLSPPPPNNFAKHIYALRRARFYLSLRDYAAAVKSRHTRGKWWSANINHYQRKRRKQKKRIRINQYQKRNVKAIGNDNSWSSYIPIPS